MNSVAPLKTVAILGAAYGGARAAQVLAPLLPDGWRIILVDRNTHANHVYILPRLSVLPGHEHKAFVPYDNVFMMNDTKPNHPHIHVCAHVKKLLPFSVILQKPEEKEEEEIKFDYAIYALGSRLPRPLNLWEGVPGEIRGGGGRQTKVINVGRKPYTGTKAEAIEWLKENQKVVEESGNVLCVGGGALGIQFATDISEVHPTKKVTLLHSRNHLLPRFDEGMHLEILKSLQLHDIDVILGERLDLDALEKEGKVRTLKGREIDADLILLCTGQSPNTDIMKAMDPDTVNESTGLTCVLRSMQITKVGTVPPEASLDAALSNLKISEEKGNEDEKASALPIGNTSYPHIFAIGDAADAFGAILAGHTAYWQGETAARNVMKLIEGKGQEELERYKPGLPAIKVSLGLRHSVYQVDGVIGTKDDGKDDMDAKLIWPFFGMKVDNDEDMHK